MYSRRRHKGGNYNPEVPTTTSYNRKPPIGNWRLTVPSWEKQFCTSVGKVPWGKILDAKKFMHYYGSVVKWDDSAGEEAFHNAKSRFYAKIHGLPFAIRMPDPDQYIDEIAWDCKIDPELFLDLECEHMVPDTGKTCENAVIFGDALLENQGLSATGWGDCEEDLKRDDNNWYQAGNTSNLDNNNLWDRSNSQNNGVVKKDGWGDSVNNSSSQYENNGGAMVDCGGWGDACDNSRGCYQYGNNYSPEYEQYPNGYMNNGKREDSDFSRQKPSRFHGDDYQRNHPSREGYNARKRVNFVSEKPMENRRTSSRGI